MALAPATSAYILSDSTLTLFHNGLPLVVHNTHPNWRAILAALQNQGFDEIVYLARPILNITRYLDGDSNFIVEDQTIKYCGEPVHELITRRILEHLKQDLDTRPLANFVRNLAENPDYWVAEQLYPFIEKGNLPLTEDGCFLAYKLVRSDYMDVYSGTVDYHIGNLVSMPRQKVDNDRTRTCSDGLHACSLEYLQHFNGDRLLAVKINPRDVVSVPADYNDTKLRCCRMEVVAELDRNLAAPAWTTPVFDYDTGAVDEPDNEPDGGTRWFIRRLDSKDNVTFWDHVDLNWNHIAWTQDSGYDSWVKANEDANALRTLYPDDLIEVTDERG